MLRLYHSFCFHAYPFFSKSLSLKINQRTSVLGIGWSFCERFIKRRSCSFLVVSSVDKESEFEVDPAKAREALRKLDEQLQSISQKQVDPPNVRASRLSSTRDENKEGIRYDTEISGSVLTNLATVLLIFTIFYNILFITVIKPAIDGPEQVEEATSSVISSE